MSKQPHLPEKYYIVWLDAHIGQPDFCVQLKRAFFTHIDPESGQEVSLSDQDINQLILNQFEFSANFDSFHFTLKPFTEDIACLKYIDEIQNDRIIFIASSILGEPAVEQLIDRYSHSFTNAKTGEAYDSIYIFCTDILRASQWAGSYVEYVKIFDFETDLLARITKDLGEEFFQHAEDLLQVNENEAAIERLSWSKSLFIRHDKLKFLSKPQSTSQCMTTPSNQQPKPSDKLKQIDRILEIVEERVKQQQENDFDEVSQSEDHFIMQTMSNEILTTEPDHLIIWIHEHLDSCELVALESEYRTGTLSDLISVQTDDSYTRNLGHLQHEVQTCFSHIPGDLRIFHDLEECQQCISENAGIKRIFFITSASTAIKMLPCWKETWSAIKKIYVFGDYITGIVDWMDHYRDHGIEILLFDLHKNLLIRLLQDVSQYYLAKGNDLKSHVSASSAILTLPYFDWAKELVLRANQLTDDDFQNQLKNIETHKNAAHKLITRTSSTGDVEQQLKSYIAQEDGDAVAIIFIVGKEIQLIHLESGIAQLITCTSNNQVISAIKNIDVLTRIIVVSSSAPSNDVLSLTQLLNYYCLLKPDESNKIPTTKDPHVTYVNSIDHLISQLYHKLGEYYRDSALEASIQSNDRDKIMRLLDRSTQCYKLLEDDTKKILKHYAEMLKKTNPKDIK